MDLSFGPDRKKYPNLGGYPAYHTGTVLNDYKKIYHTYLGEEQANYRSIMNKKCY
jgi:hypothetical protein